MSKFNVGDYVKVKWIDYLDELEGIMVGDIFRVLEPLPDMNTDIVVYCKSVNSDCDNECTILDVDQVELLKIQLIVKNN